MTKYIKNVMAIAVALVATASAFAQDAVKDITPIELEKNYRLPQGRSYWSYEAAETTRLILKSNKSDVPYPYTDSTYTDYAAAGTYYANYDGSGRIVLYMDVEKGKKYWLGANVLNTGVTFRATTKETASLDTTYVSAKEGGVLDITGGSVTSVSFDNKVDKADVTVTISSGARSAQLSVGGGKYSVSFDVRSTVCTWLKSGAVKPGDAITISIANIHAADDANVKFGTDGSLTLHYLAPTVPIALVSKQAPSKFKSYWADDAEDGYIVLEFDGAVYTGNADSLKATATIGCGQREYDGQYYSETLEVVPSGNKLTVALGGKARALAEYIAYNEDSPYVNFKLSNIRDAEGNYCFVEEQGHIASYSFSFLYEDVAIDLGWEFTPADGAELADVDSDIHLFLTDDKAITFTGVRFDYKKDGTDKSATVAKEQLTLTTEEDGIDIAIPLPADVKTGATDISLSLEGLQSTDGVERSIVAHYNVSEAAAIQGVKAGDSHDGATYTLGGVRLQKGQGYKGVVIRQGKKFHF